MKILAATFLALALAAPRCLANDASHFDFKPGTELTYKVEYAALWRDPKMRDIPNWEGELKVWPIEQRADGTTLVRARLAMNPLPLALARVRDYRVAWAEFSVGATGVSDYDFAPLEDMMLPIQLAFPLPPPLMLSWHEEDADSSRDFRFAPGSFPGQPLWTILSDDHDPFLTSWHGTQRTTCTFDPRAGRVLKLDTRADFLDGAYLWKTNKVTFQAETTLNADDAARIKHDSAELAGALAEWQTLDWESFDPVHERGEYMRLLDASQKRIQALPTVIHTPEFHEDTTMISMASFRAIGTRAQTNFAAREALLNRPSPEWTAQDLSGQAHALKDYRGKVMVLGFWPHDTPQFELGAPLLEKIAKDYAAQPVAVLGVNWFKSREAMREAADLAGLDFPQLAGGPLIQAFNLRALPTLLVIDANGVVRFQHAGWDAATDQALRREIGQLSKTKSPKF